MPEVVIKFVFVSLATLVFNHFAPVSLMAHSDAFAADCCLSLNRALGLGVRMRHELQRVAIYEARIDKHP